MTGDRGPSGEPGEADPVLYRQAGAVAVLTLNEPRTMNALSGPLKAALGAGIARAMAAPEVRCLLLTGAGKAFCAGGDLRAMSERAPAAVLERLHTSYRWMRQLTHGDKPVLAAVNGVAAGAGLSLALMCDIVLASEQAVFRAGFSAVGAVADLGIAYALPRAVGVAMARDLLLTGRSLTAAEALACGLVSRVAPHAALHEQALALAAELAAGPAALRLTRQLIRQGLESSAETFLVQEALAQAAAFNTADFAEGVAAFLEKRPPLFSGR